MKKRIAAFGLALLLSVYSVIPLSTPVRAVDPVTAVYVATSLGHLAIEAYRLWREEHPNTPDSAYPGYNPGGAVSRAAGGTTIRDDGGSSSSGTWGDDPTPTPTSVDFVTAYSEYVQDELPITTINNNNSLWIYIGGWTGYPVSDKYSYLWTGGNFPGYATAPARDTFTASYNMSDVITSASFTVPFDGVYTLFVPEFGVTKARYNSQMHLCVLGEEGYSSISSLALKRAGDGIAMTLDSGSLSQRLEAGAVYRLELGLYTYTVIGTSNTDNTTGVAMGCTVRPEGLIYVGSVPIENIEDYATQEEYADKYQASTRPISITGDYGIIGDDGTINKVTQNIVNEGSKTVYNPVTETSTTYDTWNYDYSDRSYHFSKTDTETGDTITSTVTYGDENVTIKEGDNTYNIYYITEAPAPTPTSLPTATPTQPPHVHHYTSEITTSSTCTLSGIRTYTCDGCGDSYAQAIPATGHAWEIKQQVSTQYDDTGQLIQQGYTIYRCAVCGEEYRTEDSTAPPGGTGGGTGSGTGLAVADDPTLLEYVSLVRSWGAGLKESYSGFVGLLSDVFPFLPPEVLMLFNFGMGAIVFTGIFRRFFWGG